MMPFLVATALASSAQAPVANFNAGGTSGCAPFIVTFHDLSTGNPTSWSWDFGNGQLSTAQTPSVNFSQPGVYTVRLIVKNDFGIDDEIKTDYITVSPSPTASFSANITTSCAPATIQFTDQSTAPPGIFIAGWLWDFGDGTTSNQPSPAHAYTTPGFYTVSLQVTSNSGCKNFTSIGRYIHIVGGIDVNFASAEPVTCQPPYLINFQDQSSGPGVLSYSWNFGNGTSSTSPNPGAVYNAAGTYPVQLTVQSDLGCNGTLTKNIVVAGKTTNFTFPATICIGQAVDFQNASTPAPLSSTWTFSDGTISSQFNPVKTFLSGGVYQVKLVNDYGNCTDSITKNITVITSPVVDFSTVDSTSCSAPFLVQFSDKSPAASTWLWDFGDGGTSTQQNPSHNYTNPGFYNVTLNITLAGGCSNAITKTQYIKVKSTTINIANTPAGGCIPYTYNPIPVIQSVDSIASYTWDLGEPGAIYNTKFPTHVYNSVGSYDIKLTVVTQAGCTYTTTVPNGVLTGTKPHASFTYSPLNACASTPVQFTDLSTTTPGANIKWAWNFGDGSTGNDQNPSHIYIDTGSLTVQLIVFNNGCPDDTSLAIDVLPPVANFGYTTDCNNRLNAVFIDSSLTNPALGAPVYLWNFGDGSPTSSLQTPAHTYPAFGTYTVTLSVTNGACSYQISKPVTLLNDPVDFSADRRTVCKNDTFNLTALVPNMGNITRYTWTVGSTILPDSLNTASYFLSAYGSYDVTLTVVDINGCSHSATKNNYITVSGPTAKFTPGVPGACINKPITFNDSSVPTGAPITDWTWNFGDGSPPQSSTAPPFSHTYSQTGSYSVSLKVKNSAGCVDEYSVPNAVLITNPIAAFKADTFYCPAAPLQFIDTSTGSGLNYIWDFGDGSASTLQNPTHSYTLANTPYTVKLKITDLVGCQDSVTKTNYVNIRMPKPAFDIIDSSGICIPLITSFTFKGIDYKSYRWDFGDGITTTAQNPSHFYNSYGTYIPKLYLTGPGGCVDSASARVNLYDPQTTTQILVSPTTACNSLTSNFGVTTPPGFKYEFYFGDGTLDSSRQASLTHFYPTPGNYNPYLILSDKFGCLAVEASSKIVNVYGALPLFDKDKKQFCDTGLVFFTNYTLHNDPIISTTWDFGDGTTTSVNQPSHFFGIPGTYLVKLSVTTENQCTSSYTDTIRVYKTPVLSIDARDTICINSNEVFAGVITVPDSSIKWQWTLGNGITSQAQNASTFYTATGNYNVQLVATNQLGCADTSDHPVVVVPLPTASAVSSPITILSGASTALNMNYTGPIVSYNWLPVQRLDCTDCPQPTASPQFSTDYRVEIQDRYGCKNSANISVKVICTGQNFFIPNTFSPNGDGVNDVFYLRGTGLFRVNSLLIFDRWGEVVFEKKDFPVNDSFAGWNGTYKGKKANPDVYVYRIEIICGNGETIKYSGNVALIQ